MHMQKPGSDLQLIANHPFFQFETEFFQPLQKGGVVFRPHRRFFEDHRLTAVSQFISSLLWAIFAFDNWQSYTITNNRLLLMLVLLIAVISLIMSFLEIGKAMKH